MRGPRRWVAPAVMAVTAGYLAPQGAGATPAGPGALTQPGPPPVAVEQLLGPDGEPLQIAWHVNHGGQVVARDDDSSTVVWHDGTTTVIAVPDGIGAAPVGISARGQVVANRLGMPFLRPLWPWSWEDGELTELVPREGAGFVVAVNDRGQILGVRQGGSDPTLAETVVWRDGEVTPAPAEVSATSDVYDLDDRGRALVGVDGDPDQPDTQRTAAVWQVGGGVTELGTLGGAQSLGSGINDRGQVAGVSQTASGEWHAFLWRDGEMVDLGTLGGPLSLVGNGMGPLGAALGSPDGAALNDRGDVAGTSETASGEEHAFLWRDGEMTDLGTLGGANSRAVAMNNRGQVVGYSETASGEQHAFLWQDGRMVDIGALAGEGMSVARAINDRGQIVGYVKAPGADEIAVRWSAPPPRRG